MVTRAQGGWGGCRKSCPPQRSSGTGCWTGCTSQLSPERLYSYPQMLCTRPAGWPAGRRQGMWEVEVESGMQRGLVNR